MPVVTDVLVSSSSSSAVAEMCEDVSLDSDWAFVEPQSFSFSRKPRAVCVENEEDVSYEGTPVKTPPTSRRRMMPPTPEQSSQSWISRQSSGKLRWRSREAAGMLVKERSLRKWSNT